MTDIEKLRELAVASPFKSWAAFTDDSGSAPHTNLVSFADRTDCVLSLPGRHKHDPLVAYLEAANPATILALLDQLAKAEEIRAAQADVVRHLRDRATKAESERDRMREAIEEACAALKVEARANEMSANIMRDPKRTGGWRGAENVANSYDRHGLKVSGIRAKLLAALSLSPDGQEEQEVSSSRIGGDHLCGEQPEPTSSATAALAWRPMSPNLDYEGPAWCAVRVFSGGVFLRWDIHHVIIFEGQIADDFEQGWALEDYEFWMPVEAPAAPSTPIGEA